MFDLNLTSTSNESNCYNNENECFVTNLVWNVDLLWTSIVGAVWHWEQYVGRLRTGQLPKKGSVSQSKLLNQLAYLHNQTYRRQILLTPQTPSVGCNSHAVASRLIYWRPGWAAVLGESHDITLLPMHSNTCMCLVCRGERAGGTV